MDSQLSETTQEKNLGDLSHLDGGEGNSAVQVVSGELVVRAAFDPFTAMAEEWMAKAQRIHVTSIEQTEEMDLARESRLGLRKVRVSVEHLRKDLKADLLVRGREIDRIAGALAEKILPVEAHLREQEEFAARHEAARLDTIRTARGDELRALGTDPALYTDLAHVSADGYAQILAIAQRAHAARVEETRLAEIAKAEEAQRIAAAEEAERLERVRQAEENARLKAEVEAHEAIIRAEREAAAEALRLEREERERQDAIREEALRIEREAAAAIAREKEEAARVEREKVEAALRQEREAREAREREERAQAEALAERARQAALAPDREKLLTLAGLLLALANGEEVTVRLPTLSTPEGIESGAKVRDQIAKLAAGTRRLGGGL